MRKGQHFRWDEQQQAFDELKERLTTAPVLASPRSNGKYYLDTNASDCGLGIVLSQEQDGLESGLKELQHHQEGTTCCCLRTEAILPVSNWKRVCYQNGSFGFTMATTYT